jgi:hypothetical protein
MLGEWWWYDEFCEVIDDIDSFYIVFLKYGIKF